ncbi:MAG: 3-phosphoglycerate dehydrogenase family protein [Vicinamibacterales bacterium]
MKVLVADTFEQSGISGLKLAGCDVIFQPDLKDEALRDAIAETQADVLVVRGTAVTGAMLEAGALSLIVRAGAGYNTIDVAAASRRGIYVSNCPGKNAVAVAELAMGLMLALDRRIPDGVAELRAGRWNKKEYSKARGLYGSTLGLIGYGNIGQEVATRALGFGMSVVVWSRRFANGEAHPDLPVAVVPRLEALAEAADVVSVHVALSKETRGMIGPDFFGRMKPGAMFINTARGEVVDYAALENAVRARGIRVGLDVFPGEPAAATADFVMPLTSLPGVYGTHHIGASTDQAQEAIAAETVRVITAYMTTGRVPNVVNLAKVSPASHMLVVRHRDRPGVLAHVFDQLRLGGINVQETENIIFEGAEAAVARINLDGEPAATVIDALRAGNSDILDVRVVPL